MLSRPLSIDAKLQYARQAVEAPDYASTWIASGYDSLGRNVPGWPDSGLKTHFMWHTGVS